MIPLFKMIKDKQAGMAYSSKTNRSWTKQNEGELDFGRLEDIYSQQLWLVLKIERAMDERGFLCYLGQHYFL